MNSARDRGREHHRSVTSIDFVVREGELLDAVLCSPEEGKFSKTTTKLTLQSGAQCTGEEKSYQDIYLEFLAKDRDPTRLIDHFLNEDSGLALSDALGSDFSLAAVFKRLNKGHPVSELSYNNSQVREVQMRLKDNQLELTCSGKKKRVIKLENGKGVVVGPVSTHDRGATRLPRFQCFSVLSPSRSYDFFSASDLNRHDFLIGISWAISLNIAQKSCDPLTHSNVYTEYLLLLTGTMKIKEMAKEKGLSVNELYMVNSTQLSMIKYLRTVKDTEGEEKIRKLLKRRFFLLMQATRYSVGKGIHSNTTLEEARETARIRTLSGRRTSKLNPSVMRGFNFEDLTKLSAHTIQESYRMPSIKEIFKIHL